MNKHIKNFIVMGGVCAALMIAVSAEAQTSVRTSTEAEATVVACTMDARMCPDGSYVGRTGPKCEFAPCPGEGGGASGSGTVSGNTTGSAKGGNVEFEWKVEEGESAPPAPGEAEIALKGDAGARGESGEKGGTEDINIGVGELQENAIGSANGGVWKTTDGGVSVRAVEVRGWDPEKKKEFLATVRAHAELQSGQDLENFARGILVEDEKVSEVTADENGVGMKYQIPARFLGVLNASFRMHTMIDANGEVKVVYPWYAFLFRDYTSADEVRADIVAALQAEVDAEAMTESAKAGGLLQALHVALKAGSEKWLRASGGQ